MPMYDFRCDEHGVRAKKFSMADVPATSTCPDCAAVTKRVFTSPALGSGNSRAMRTIDASKQTAEKPGVVTSLPSQQRPSRPVSFDPRHAKLPKP